MKRFLLYYLLVTLTSFVFGSSASSSSSDEEEIVEINDPATIKQLFISAVKSANAPECRELIEKNDYLVSRFNRDIFDGLISCFDLEGKGDDCWAIFEMIQPSFADVSSSTTTPLIMSIRRNKFELFKALIQWDSVKSTIDNADEFSRTALMYATKRGSFLAIRKIIEISTGAINKKDFLDKTVLHYACEMNPLEVTESALKIPSFLTGEIDANVANKLRIFTTLMANGAKIDYHGPEFKLTSADRELKNLIESNGGKVAVSHKVEDVLDKVVLGYTAFQLAHSFNLTPKIISVVSFAFSFILENPFMIMLNELCFQIQKFLLPGVDLNFVVTFDLGNEFKDVSFNLLFLMILIPTIAEIAKNLKKPNVFKF